MLNKVIIEIGEDKNVSAEIINSYQINIRFSVKPEIVLDDHKIVFVGVGESGLSLFDKIKVPIDHKINSVYEIHKIEKLSDEAFSLYSTIGTKSKQFILPCLGFDREYYLYDTFLENVYIKLAGNISKELPKCPLFLLYRYSESELFKLFESRISKHLYYKSKIDVNNYEVLYIFDISSFKTDVNKFIQGKYSELSSKLKSNILKFHNYTTTGTMSQILTKDTRLRRQLEIKFDTNIKASAELYDIPDIATELYHLN